MAAVLRSMMLKVRKGSFVGLEYVLLLPNHSLCIAEDAVVRECGRKEKPRQVCLHPSSKTHVHLKEVFGFYLVVFKVDQSLYF